MVATSTIGTEVRPLQQTDAVKWALYLTICGLSGLWWLPVVLAIGVEGGLTSGPVLRQTLAWLILTGLAVGIPYRLLSERLSGAPRWFPLLIPAIAALLRSLTPLLFGMRSDFEAISDEILSGIVQGYLCFGIMLIPFAYGHIAALRWLDGQLSRFIPRLTQRGFKRLAYGAGCLAFIGISEVPRLFESNRAATLVLVEKKLGLRLPPKAEVLYQHYSKDFRSVSFQNGSGDEAMVPEGGEVWIRSEDRVTLPEKMPFGLQLVEPTVFHSRLSRYVDIDVDVIGISAFAWKQGKASVQVAIFQTKAADYVRYKVEGE